MVVFGGEAKHVNGGVDNNLKKPNYRNQRYGMYLSAIFLKIVMVK